MGRVKVVMIEKYDDGGVLVRMTTLEKPTGLYGSPYRTSKEVQRFIEETLGVKLKG